MTHVDDLHHYARHGRLTEPGAYAHCFDGLPSAVGSLCGVMQGLIIHADWATLYGHSAAMSLSRMTLPVADRLALLDAAGDGPLPMARPVEARTSGTCRDFALMLCGALRHRAIPARVRCGFATYFSAGPFEDHWVCEYWHQADRRWAFADAQLDALHRQHLDIDFDIADLPAGKFLTAGTAWRMWRTGAADPDTFGHGSDTGAWFMRVNLVRDLLALHKQETSAWDTWRTATEASKILDEETLRRCNRIADVTASPEHRPPAPLALPPRDAVTDVPPWPV